MLLLLSGWPSRSFGYAYKIDLEWLEEDEEALILALATAAMHVVDKSDALDERNGKSTGNVPAGSSGLGNLQ